MFTKRIKKTISCFLVILSIHFSGIAQSSFILQPGPTDGKDARVWSLEPGGNFPDYIHTKANAWTWNSVFGIERTYIEFDLSSISTKMAIVEAKLSFFYHYNTSGLEQTNSGDNSLIIQSTISLWSENTLTWNNQPLTTELNQVEVPPATDPQQDYTDIIVTDLVIDALNVNNSYFSFLIRIKNEEIYRRFAQASSDHPIPEKRPKLEIFYNCFINLGNDTTICAGDSIVLSADSDYESYLWNTGNTDSAIYISAPGVYWLEATDLYGCVAVDTIYIEFLPTANLNLGNDTTICENETLLLDAGYGFQNYLWQDGSTNQFIWVNTPGIYQVEIIDENYCSTTDEIIVEQVIVSVDLGQDTSLCPEYEITLSPGNLFDGYIWLDGLSNASYFTTDTGGIYWVTCIDTSSNKTCFGTDSIKIDMITPPISPALDKYYSICPEDEILIDAGVGSSNQYLWNNLFSDSIILVQDSGLYYISISNICDTIYDSVYVFYYPAPQPNIQIDTISDNNFELSVNQIFETYLWSNGVTNPMIQTDLEDDYWVEVTNSFGCIGTDSIYVESTDCFRFIPVVITPNNDLSNDYFYLESQYLVELEINIFNRWGEVVFTSKDINFKWDGTKDGKNCNDGTYFYTISYNCNKFTQNSQNKILKGSILLLR